MSEHALDKLAHRTLTLKPHKKSYQDREVICVYVTVNHKKVTCLAVTEYGEQITNLANHFLVCPVSYIVATNDPAWLAQYMYKRYSHLECFQIKVTEARGEDDTGEIKSNLSRFGFTNGRARQQSGRRKAMHTVWSSSDFPTTLFPDGQCDFAQLLEAAVDVRNYCKEKKIPIPNRPKGIAGDFMKDEQFWPDARGRVPEFINETLRPFLPGNHMELRSNPLEVVNVWSIDMRAAYHRVAQTVNIPDHTSIYARGYSRSWRESPIWFACKTPEYEREINRPGLVIVEASSRPTRQNEWRPRAINFTGKKRIALWTNEIKFCESMGLNIHGLVCAWTSTNSDNGLTRYGAFAEPEANNADAYRRQWLKPTLHTLYGMFAARKKHIRIGHLRGSGRPYTYMLKWGYSLELSSFEVPFRSHPLANVAILGTLQAEIRMQMMKLANDLEAMNTPVTHMHADGIHVEAIELPLLGENYTTEQRIDLVYLDDVSWIWADGETLPGRPEVEKLKEVRRYKDMLNAGAYGYRRKFANV